MLAGNSAAQVSTDLKVRTPLHTPSGSCAKARSSRRNHGSIEVRSWTASISSPRRKSSRITSKRSGPGVSRLSRSCSSAIASSRGGLSSSRERSAFANAWPKVRPIAIASPTDFMCVDSVDSTPGNFSKAKRGHFTTT